MDEKLVKWLSEELRKRGWSHRELARRAKTSQTAVSTVVNGERKAGWDFCLAIAHALDEPPVKIFQMAGLLDISPPPSVNVSDSAKIDDIWKALQQSPLSFPPKKDYPEDNHPEIEIICEIWEQLDAAERQIVYDFVRWRYDEQYRRRTSSGKRRVDRAQKEKDRQYNIDVIDLRLSLEKASADQIALAISSLQEVLAEKIAREAASAGTLRG